MVEFSANSSDFTSAGRHFWLVDSSVESPNPRGWYALLHKILKQKSVAGVSLYTVEMLIAAYAVSKASGASKRNMVQYRDATQ